MLCGSESYVRNDTVEYAARFPEILCTLGICWMNYDSIYGRGLMSATDYGGISAFGSDLDVCE